MGNRQSGLATEEMMRSIVGFCQAENPRIRVAGQAPKTVHGRYTDRRGRFW